MFGSRLLLDVHDLTPQDGCHNHTTPSFLHQSLRRRRPPSPRRHAPAPTQHPHPTTLFSFHLHHITSPPPLPRSELHPHLLYLFPRRLLSAAAPPRVSPNPSSFAVEDHLVDACGLTRPQALKASAKLSHLKPDVVFAYLAGRGFSSSDVAALVTGDPRSLSAGVERTLAAWVNHLKETFAARCRDERRSVQGSGCADEVKGIAAAQVRVPLLRAKL
ncbi:hypothetical protein ZWY2020_015722 [Hordeum vulgare]|nr:hypothetical protein ZWY2020_015722 [Hordeum vulgare]